METSPIPNPLFSGSEAILGWFWRSGCYGSCMSTNCTYTPCLWWSSSISAWLHSEKNAVMLMSRRLELDEIQMSLCGLAWLTCMQSVVAWRMLGECSTSCHHVMWSLGRPWYKTCTMWAFRHKRQWNYWGLSHPALPILHSGSQHWKKLRVQHKRELG